MNSDIHGNDTHRRINQQLKRTEIGFAVEEILRGPGHQVDERKIK